MNGFINSPSDTCDYCNLQDNLMYFFIICEKIKAFWV